jgi:hypothetical protein
MVNLLDPDNPFIAFASDDEVKYGWGSVDADGTYSIEFE